ncbi:MAG: outer membrane beta-barrel protein [Ignavibacteria bacterium]|nr:outer membrane beta-barrel protein [Ignavibacteria bacterium]
MDFADTVKASKYQIIKNPVGTDFWICFMKNFQEEDPKRPAGELILELFLTGDEDTRVTIEIPGLNYRTQVFVRGKTIQSVRIPASAQVKSFYVIEKLSVHITSERPIFVYGLNRRFQTTDTFLAFPVDVLGTEYRVMSYTVSIEMLPIFAIVATEDATDVTIIPSFDTENNPANVPFTVRMNKGDVYQVAAKFVQSPKCDLTGSIVRANKKIAVFGGHQCAYVPPNKSACNHLVEQMPPISSWGKHYYLGILKSRRNYTFRVLANEPDTRVFVDGKLIRTLNGGEFFDSLVNKPLQITANKPILVAQFSHGYNIGDSIGDPMMLLVSPTQQFLKSYRFATPVNGEWRHFINVVIPTVAIRSLRLNGAPVDSSLFEQIGISRYSIGYIQVEYGSHFIEADLPFGMYSYGFGYGKDAYDAYGTMAGQSFIEYEPAKDSLPPIADGKPTSDGFELVVRDDREDDTGLQGISIVSNFGFDVNVPKIELGTPQIMVKAKPSNIGYSSRLTFVATDLALNVSEWTLCFTFDPARGKSFYQVLPGLKAKCRVNPGYNFGVFATTSLGFNSPGFSSTGNIVSFGQFQNSVGIGGFGGLFISKFFDEHFCVSARTTFENYAGSIESPDTITSKIRLDDGSFASFNEGRKISLKGLFLGISLLVEYHLYYGFFLSSGFEFDFALSKSIDFIRYIINPPNVSYSDGKRELLETNLDKINSLNSLRTNFLLGVGYNFFFNPRFGIFSEIQYKYPLSSLINDGDWFYSRISLNLGLRFRF